MTSRCNISTSQAPAVLPLMITCSLVTCSLITCSLCFLLQTISVQGFSISSSDARRNHLHHPALKSSTLQDNINENSQDNKNVISCSHCGETFQTRNALFRHLRNDPLCSKVNYVGNQTSITDAFASVSTNKIFQKDTVTLLFAYDSFLQHEETYDSFVTRPSHAEIVSGKIIDAFNFALDQEFGYEDSFQQEHSKSEEDKQHQHQHQHQHHHQPEKHGVVKSTQVSVAKLRLHKSFTQENGISAAGDVMTLSYKYPVAPTLLDESKQFRETKRYGILQRLKESAIQFLTDEEQLESIGLSSTFKPGSTNISNIRILSVQLLPRTTTFHSERSCTQRAYHYILPVKWIDGDDEIRRWWLDNNQISDVDGRKATSTQPKTSNNAKFGIKGQQRVSSPSPKQLAAFKKILKTFECEERASSYLDSDKNDNLSGSDVASKKRYGLLAKKSFRAWHNFADPTIRGSAVSPNNKSVWRALDRCRIVQFMTYRDDEESSDGAMDNSISSEKDQVMLIVELRGDDFIQQQARRIIGSAVAIANGWLPSNFAQIATSPDVFIETPIAPINLMYQARPRFHYDELMNGGKSIFYDEDFDQDLEVTLTDDLHSRITQKFIEEQSLTCQEWIKSMKYDVTPRIREKIRKQLHPDEDMTKLQLLSSQYTSTPVKYTKALHLLQEIVSSGKWPSTSIARSRVIKDHNDPKSEAEKYPEVRKQNGSFTIINPKYMNGILMNTKTQTEVRVPLGNTLFPDLVHAVFELESSLALELFGKDEENGITSTMRPPSSHCAINCNAQFTPHVDSGRGSGQTVSMIVGLGTYIGGELYVENESFDICYKPKQFDGWRDRKLLYLFSRLCLFVDHIQCKCVCVLKFEFHVFIGHWTAPFQGQRYSLVWFTPEMKGVND